MRTTKRFSLPINNGKWNELTKIARLFRDEKNLHLHYYNVDKNYVTDKSNINQQMRNVKMKYTSPNHLQARQWKISQKAAYETVDKNWCALAVDIKSLIARHKGSWSNAEMHYAYWLSYSGKRLAALTDEKYAPIPEHFDVSYSEQKRVRNYLRRVIRRKRGERSVARLTRSFNLDSDMYSVFENETLIIENGKGVTKKTQFISIMGLVRGKRVVVPLTGFSNFSGNIKIILDFQKQRIEVHTTTNLPEIKTMTGEVVALDAGMTEVFTDNKGNAYEPEFGEMLTSISKKLNLNSKARNKSYALKKVSSKFKAKRIRKFNLGKKKQKSVKNKSRVRVQQVISQAVHQVVKKHHPAIIVTEKLDIRGKAKSKGMSRLVSFWMRKILLERLEFLALAEGFCHQQVNPAYTSQMCPTCLFVHKDNRKGDMFQCLNCRHTDHADWVAAINLLARFYDHDITVYTPKSVVFSILQSRFVASLEKCVQGLHAGTLSVSGRTDMDSSPCQSETPPLNTPIPNERGTGTFIICT
jgi:IS605 OrfB family transposase